MRPLVRGSAPVLRDLRRRGNAHWRLKHVQVCTSTELELVRWLERQAWRGGHPRAVFATHQTRSHGQHGRVWLAPRGGVWLSAALPWPHPIQATGLFGLVVALALAEQLEAQAVPVCIKWPNDLLVHSRKLAGILPTLVFRGSRVRQARVGIGLNVCNAVPSGAVALKQLLPRGRCRLRGWQSAVLQALDRSMDLAGDPAFVVRQVERRLWSDRVRDPRSGDDWQVQGLGLDGRLLLAQGNRTCSWTRWGDSHSRSV